jgi:hypothetical protein
MPDTKTQDGLTSFQEFLAAFNPETNPNIKAVTLKAVTVKGHKVQVAFIAPKKSAAS